MALQATSTQPIDIGRVTNTLNVGDLADKIEFTMKNSGLEVQRTGSKWDIAILGKDPKNEAYIMCAVTPDGVQIPLKSQHTQTTGPLARVNATLENITDVLADEDLVFVGGWYTPKPY
ncbi:hypothetical protein HYX02_06665 [Candidatus Woesearchaeota archaeon]|nr:hypothetical protein [Candidatus Woesearchaeota archaeon]